MPHAGNSIYLNVSAISLGPWCKTCVLVKKFMTFDRFMNLWLNNSNISVYHANKVAGRNLQMNEK